MQQGAGDRTDDMAAEEAVAGAADDDQVRVLLLGEIDQRFGERLPDEHCRARVHSAVGQCADGTGDPLLAAVR